ILAQLARFAGLHVDRHQVAKRKKALIVVGKEGGSAARVVGQRCNLIEHCPLDVGDVSDAAVSRAECADVLDDTGNAEPAIRISGGLVVVDARYRTDRAPDKSAVGRDRVLPHLLEVLSLELTLEGYPVLPGLLDGETEHLLELVGPVAPASLVAPIPFDDL